MFIKRKEDYTTKRSNSFRLFSSLSLKINDFIMWSRNIFEFHIWFDCRHHSQQLLWMSSLQHMKKKKNVSHPCYSLRSDLFQKWNCWQLISICSSEYLSVCYLNLSNYSQSECDDWSHFHVHPDIIRTFMPTFPHGNIIHGDMNNVHFTISTANAIQAGAHFLIFISRTKIGVEWTPFYVSTYFFLSSTH